MNARRHIIIVGASQAGCACASALRGFGFDGEITLLGDEPHRPYTRPPLSKGVLIGAASDDSVFLPALDDVSLLGGVAAVGLDRSRNVVELAGGESLPYDGLVIATGSRARRLNPAGGDSELTVRTLDDAIGLRQRLGSAREVTVAGGGFLGMEIASSAASLGKSVTVVDGVSPLAGRLGSLLSGMLLDAAAEQGARVRVVSGGVTVGFEHGTPDRLLSADGTLLAEADIVVTAVGDIPNTEWLHGSGVHLDGGVVVDDECRVAPGIVGAGDVVSVRRADGRCVRSPHWSNALSQARTAAATLLGREPSGAAAAATPPFFWTEAFGLKVRLAGHLPPVGEPTVIDGSIADRRVLLAWRAAGQEQGFGTAAAVNYPMSAPKLAKLAQQVLAH
ncbi:NAD(P)/FAD-dependent oxidoreductase [Streptomyces sp. NPDC048438]|uniref:NAD(P)/FAD-dependent oxidoreductase n=1 Tax=Streptomyces sp. NPDC048438 TaxID=3365551 RepID=UPI0037196B49